MKGIRVKGMRGLLITMLLCAIYMMTACGEDSENPSQAIQEGAQILVDSASEHVIDIEEAEIAETTETDTETLSEEDSVSDEAESEEEVTEVWVKWGVELPGTEPPVFEVTDAEETFYKDWLTFNILDIVENVEEAEYGFYDVNYDGVAELIVREPLHLYVLQKQNDEVVLLNEETKYMSLLPNGMLMKFEVAADRHEYNFYLLEEGGYELCRTLSRRDTAEGGYGKFYASEDERLIDGEAVSKDEWDELLYDILIRYWGRYEKDSGEIETYQYYLAEVEFTKFMGGAPEALPYATEEEAYQAFIDGECGAYLGDNYSDENAYYMTFMPIENHPYYMYEIINLLLNDRWGGSTDATFADYYTYDVKTANIDCGLDGRKELLLEFEKEEFQVHYILQYRDGQLYFCYAIDQVARSYVQINEHGYITDSGSGGACVHGGEAVVLDGNCEEHLIYKWYSVTRGDSYLNVKEDDTDDLVNEVLMQYYQENEKGIYVDLYGFELAYYYINGKYYYMYYIDEEEEKENPALADLRTAYEESGIDFYTYEEIKVLIDAERNKWGVPEPTDSSWVYPQTIESYEYYD